MNTNIKKRGLSISLILLAFLIIGFFSSFTNSSSFNNSMEYSGVELDITLGRGPGCTGRGICTLNIAAASQGQQIDAKGKLYYNTNNKLTLDIYKRFISVWDMNQQIVNDKFKLINGYTITNEIMSQLGTPGNHTITPGDYSVDETSSSFVIEF